MRRRVPVYLQSTAVECGAACLAMVLGHHGCHIPVAELRDRMVLARDGASAARIAEHARALGLTVHGYSAEPDALGKLRLPLIAHWGMNHFVVIEGLTKSTVDIVDPAAGRRRLSRAEFDESFTGVVLELTPTPALQRRRPERRGLWSFVRPFLPRGHRAFTSILLASLVLSLLGLVPALVTKYLVDRVLPGGDVGVLAALGIGLLGYAIGYGAVTLARAEFLLWLQVRIDHSMMTAFLRHLMSLPYKFFQLRSGGDLLVRASSTAYVRDLVSSQLLAVILDASLLGIYLAVIGLESQVFVLAIAAVAVTQLLVMVVSAPRARRLTERELMSLGEANSTLLETITGAGAIKASGAEDVAVARWSDRFADQLDASVRRRRLDNGIDAILALLGTASPLLMLGLGAYLFLQGALSLGAMFALVSLAGAALAPVGQLGRSIKSLQVVRVHLARLRDVFDEQPEDAEQGDLAARLDAPITLTDVSFRYAADGPPVLHGISLTIAPGEKVAIVGHSGSGKSTLSRVMLGLYQPTNGRVSYGDTDVRDLDLVRLRRQCGVVTQEASIFSGSVLSNIAFAAPEAGLDDIVWAARMAGVHDDIVRMPMGYETVLGEGGSGLSGGQRQRLALARAIVTRPRLLLLDEATSHLDATTEATVAQNVSMLDCTTIVVAHRLSTVRDADRIVVLDAGRIVESGRHDDLVSRDGAYAALVNQQLVG